jgi:hypothetical protein
MIVRISTEGQYELAEDDVETLNELDNQTVQACEAGDEQRFRDTFSRTLELVRTNGRPVEDDALFGSDVILPPPDTSMQEAAAEFTGEGLIPG